MPIQLQSSSFLHHLSASLLFLTSLVAPILSALVIYRLSYNLSSLDPLENDDFIDVRPNFDCNPNPAVNTTSTLPPCPCSDDLLSGLPTCRIWLNVRTSNGPSAALILAGGIGILVAMFGVWQWTRITRPTHDFDPASGTKEELRSLLPTQTRRFRTLFSIYALTFTFALALTLYIFIDNARSADISVTQGYGESVLTGTYAREKWVCGLAEVVERTDGQLEWAGKTCTQARVARWLLVPVCGFLGGLMGCAGWRWIRSPVRTVAGVEREAAAVA